MDQNLCPICNSKKTLELYPSDIDLNKISFTYVKTPDCGKTFRSLRCLNCSHVFCSPLPKDIYKNYKDVVDKKYLRYAISITDSAKIILPIIKKIIPKGRMLDVGCATGEFLYKAREFGYSVEGLELSSWSSKIAIKKNLKIYKALLKPLANKYSNRYDVITLFGVIEHFQNPREEMKYIEKLLKPGGILVIWTGDVNSISSKVLGHNWWYWQGQHIQYFSSKSLRLLTNKFNIKHLITKTYPFVARYDLVENSLNRYLIGPFISKLLKPLFMLKKTWVLYLPGEMLWIGRKSFKK